MQKTNFKTRLLALLTAVFMVVVCVPFAAFAAHSEIVVTFNKGDEEPVQYVLDENKVAPKAPPADGGKWYPNVEGAPVLNGGDSVLYSQMDPYACGEYNGQTFISYEFKADEKEPEPVEKTVNINLNTVNNKGTFVGYDGAETISF